MCWGTSGWEKMSRSRHVIGNVHTDKLSFGARDSSMGADPTLARDCVRTVILRICPPGTFMCYKLFIIVCSRFQGVGVADVCCALKIRRGEAFKVGEYVRAWKYSTEELTKHWIISIMGM